MNKCFTILLIALSLTSCSAKNEHYYKTHPTELQQALKSCPDKQPQGLTCAQLNILANHMNKLAYELQLSPQGFGKKIIALQETIAKEQEQLSAGSDNKNLQNQLAQNQQNLSDYLVIVRWFESPAS